MDALFNRLDEQVETALQTLFPPANDISATSDAQQRAQDFATQVGIVHNQLIELKGKLDDLPSITNDPHAMLEKEIADLRQDIKAKDEVLERHRDTLSNCADRLNQVDRDNRAQLEGRGEAS
ncbi:hypothetical protein GQ54DRAFT_259453 [Martensiomyces pterosporus]|nr:hypothetical protein GQ54DRAFT_259453 [Martensiomyces pterosporus]